MSDDAYILKQRQRDADYRREYAAWVEKLSPEERRKLKAQGIDAPSVPGAVGGMADAASSSRARCEAKEIDEDDEPPDEHDEEQEGASLEEPAAASEAPQPLDAEGLHDLLRRLVGELVSQDQAKLALECLALVTGLAYEGDSMTAIASKYGVTRAAVSKRCVDLTAALNLKPSRAMRSPKARHSYRKTRTLKLRSES